MVTSPSVVPQKNNVRDYLEAQIISGELAPGDKLPTERALAERFGIARNTVRSVLKALEEQGKIVRLIGRGTFVSGPQRGLHGLDRDVRLDASPAEVMEVRLMLEPAVAEAVVTRASGADLAHIETCLERAEAAHGWQEFEKWDSALHASMVRSTRNQFLIRIFERIDYVRSQAEWGKLKRRSLTEERRRAYQKEHRQIVEALRERDAALARELVVKHLRHVRRNLLGY